ncbi:MAG: hypothetical protein Q7S87_14025 [Agitococcus sp.]|nr:hypothetical protein [Agitococcus sp.]
MAFDASPSWSGFNYQGKVALYYALKLINDHPISQDLSNYSLMLEATEDFEIQRDGVSLSYHQVKAYAQSSYSTYSNALFGVLLELYKSPSVTGWIHTWNAINSKPDFADLTSSIQDDMNIVIAQYTNKKPGEKGIVLDDAASDKKGITKQAAIIRAAIPGKTSDQLRDILNEIVLRQNDCLSRFAAYEYDDGNKFCDLTEINIKIKFEISRAMSARGTVVTQEQLEKCFNYFLGYIDEHIICRHENKTKTSLPIGFQEIVVALRTDHEDIGSEYLVYKFKDQFAYLIDEYLGDPDDYTEPAEEVYCNLMEARKLLLGLSPKDLWKHYRSFSPQIYLQHTHNTVNALSTNPEGIRHVLLKILHAINFACASHNATKYKLTYRTTTSPYQFYLPTTITSTARVSQIVKKITENPSMNEILFEVENLIYGGQERFSFSPSLIVRTEAPIADGDDTRSKRDEILKEITLVPISIAKDLLT